MKMIYKSNYTKEHNECVKKALECFNKKDFLLMQFYMKAAQGFYIKEKKGRK